MAEPPIAWEQGIELEGIPTSLTASVDDTVTVGMRVDEEGDFVVSFVCGISGKSHSLPEIEAFIRRASHFLDELEV